MAKFTKEFLKKHLAALSDQAGQARAAAMFEAGKAVGRTEGQIWLLTQLVNLADPEEVPAEEPRAEPELKIVKPVPATE